MVNGEKGELEAYAPDAVALQAKLRLARKIAALLAIVLLLASAVLNLWTYLEHMKLQKDVKRLEATAQVTQRRAYFLTYLHQQLVTLSEQDEQVRSLLKNYQFSFDRLGMTSQSQEGTSSPGESPEAGAGQPQPMEGAATHE